tara:strand:+ start:2861 stop:3595 length:735 start_codon:yes stop_codon:yes gene_type:complete
MIMLNCSVTPYINHISEKKIAGFPGICYQCNFYPNGYSDSIVKQLLGEHLHISLGRAVIKRRAEFVAGRYLARKALIALNASTTIVETGANREPLWPSAYVGSISHSNEFAICAVANKNDVKTIGIDVENFFDIKVAREIINNVLIESEHMLVGTLGEPNPIVLTIIFSAKESLFKALYSEVGHFFDFDAAQIEVIDFQTGKFKIKLVKKLGSTLPAGSSFEGTFEISKNQVFTTIICLNVGLR